MYTSKTVQTTTKQVQLFIQKSATQLDELSTLLSTTTTTTTSPETKILNQTFDSNVNRCLLGNAPIQKVQFHLPLPILIIPISAIYQLCP
mmetsp:Transcript_32099/g.47888  ORF Transcript_32099/g.47888 Transcript_32099/m.47888 type:complete len:90 (-) Transcript_32099:136-405(-)